MNQEVNTDCCFVFCGIFCGLLASSFALHQVRSLAKRHTNYQQDRLLWLSNHHLNHQHSSHLLSHLVEVGLYLCLNVTSALIPLLCHLLSHDLLLWTQWCSCLRNLTSLFSYSYGWAISFILQILMDHIHSLLTHLVSSIKNHSPFSNYYL